MPIEPNTLLHNRYRILEELGRGGMGAVYRGRDESLGIEVAIKENLFVSPETERQFKREASLLAALRHPVLPRVTDHFVIPEVGQYLVMDFIPGEDARQILERQDGPLPEETVLRWAKDILEAVHYLHTREPQIIHRDIKPGNIKITPDGRTVLVDFGLAKKYDPDKSTTVGAKAFTPGFAPPEQYGQGRTDKRTDIYSLGATLYNLLTNLIPADGLARLMGLQRLIPILEANPVISSHVAMAIERAIAIKPEDRFPSIREFADALIAKPTRVVEEDATLLAEYVPPAEYGEVTRTPAVAHPTPAHSLPTRISPKAEVVSPVPTRKSMKSIRLVTVILLAVIAVGVGVYALFNVADFFARIEFVSTPPPTLTIVEEVVAPASTATRAVEVIVEPTSEPEPEATPTAEFISEPEVTPHGGGPGQIAFVSERAGIPQIFMMNIDGSNVIQLTTMPDGACQPAWSPEGDRLLFVSPCRKKSDEYPNAAVYVMNADGSDIQPLITLVGGVFDPDWSTAGIVFTFLENNKPRLWFFDQNSGTIQQISGSNAYDRQPSWSPGGDKLVLMNTSRSGSPTIYWVFADGSFDGSNPEQVTREQKVSSPDWSPLGDLIAYVASDAHIWVGKWDGLGFGVNKLTTKGPNADPDWSPDGQWIVFESWRDAANHDIYVMTANGGMSTRLTDDSSWDYQPAWRP